MPRRHEDTKIHKERFNPLKEEEERIGKAIVDAVYRVHKTLVSGLLERVYNKTSCYFVP